MKVAVIGSALVDIIAKSDQPLVLNDSSPGQTKLEAGGVGRNIAETLAHLKEDVALVSTFGNDYHAQFMLDSLNQVGVDTSFIYKVEGRSATYTSIFDDKGDLVYGIADTKTAKILPQKIDEALSKADILVFSSNHSIQETEALIRKYQDKIIVVDPISTTKSLAYVNVLNLIHTLKCNLLEAETLCQTYIKSLEDVPTLVNNLLDMGIKRVFITLGESGSYYADKKESGFVAAIETEVVNVSGAGDAFTAGLVFGILQNLNIQETVAFATFLSKTSLESEKAVNPHLLREVLDYVT